MGGRGGLRNLASSDAQEMPERSKNVEKCGKKSKKSRRMILFCTAAVLLIAARRTCRALCLFPALALPLPRAAL